MDNKSTVSLNSVFLNAQARIEQSSITKSTIAYSPIEQSKVAQSPVVQSKVFQPEIPASEFLNLSFDQLSQVAVRAYSSNRIQSQFQAKAEAEVTSKENFLQMPLEKLMNLPVKVATLGKNDKDKDKKDTQDVTSNPASINFQAIPVFSNQALESVTSYNTNLENTSTNTTDTDSADTTSTTTTTTTIPPIPPPSPPTVIPLLVPKIQFLANANFTDQNISILLRNSNGTFSIQPSVPVGAFATSFAIADFNGDNILDLVVGDNTNLIKFFPGIAPGIFGSSTNISPINSPTFIVAQDFNQDNKVDFAVVNSNGVVSIFLGNGNGTFMGPTAIPTPGFASTGLAAGDFNKDGIVDLAVLHGAGVDMISILLGNGLGGFSLGSNFSGAGFGGQNIIAADFNNDGILDLATCNFGVGVGVFLGNGNGTFGFSNTTMLVDSPFYMAAADFDRDGNLDIVTCNTGANSLSILFGTGIGTFGSPNNIPINSPISVVAGDFNEDGSPDFAVTNDPGSVSVFLNNGNGTFQVPVVYPVGDSPEFIGAGILPAGISGAPINLGLENYFGNDNLVTIKINNIPLGWALNTGVDNLDGSWTVQTSNPELLTITTSVDFIGSRVLEVDMSSVLKNGNIEHVYFKNNIEAYALDSAIFALPNDNLTGSDNADTFVITQSNPLVLDKIFNFDVMLDKIDLIDFHNLNDFSDLIIQNDTYGNALVHLGSDNQTILLYGIDTSEVSESNFLFNVTPHTINTDKIDIGKDSIMPFNGVLENNGIIQVDGRMIVQGDIIGEGKIVIGNEGILDIKGHIAQNLIFETSNTPIIFSHTDINLYAMTSISLELLLECFEITI